MEQSVKYLLICAVTYIVFLCVIRIILGAQYKSRSFRVNIIGIITVFGNFILAKSQFFSRLPEYLHYIIPVLVVTLLPPLSLNMKTSQILKYLLFTILAALILHVCFSFFLSWNELLPFIKIPSM